MINLKLLGAFIGQECIEHPIHGKYILDGFYSKGVMATRNLTGAKEDEEYEMFGWDEVVIIFPAPVTPNKLDILEKEVCEFICIEPEELQKRSRKREVVEGRQILHYLAKNNKLASLSEIGQRFGKKDHATVLYSCRTVSNLLSTDHQFKRQYENLINTLSHG